MSMATELAQRTDLLIANGQQTADLLRHLADNEIDSDYFAVTSECEAYGTEIDVELTITDFALRAAGYVDALVEALEAAEKRSADMEVACELFAESKLAQIKLEAALEKAHQRIAELDISRDKCFLSGLKTGWEYGIADDTEGYNREIADAKAVIDRASGVVVGAD